MKIKKKSNCLRIPEIQSRSQSIAPWHDRIVFGWYAFWVLNLVLVILTEDSRGSPNLVNMNAWMGGLQDSYVVRSSSKVS